MAKKKGDTVKSTFSIPVELKRSAEQEARRLGISLSGLICISLNEYIKQNTVKDVLNKMDLLTSRVDSLKSLKGISNENKQS